MPSNGVVLWEDRKEAVQGAGANPWLNPDIHWVTSGDEVGVRVWHNVDSGIGHPSGDWLTPTEAKQQRVIDPALKTPTAEQVRDFQTSTGATDRWDSPVSQDQLNAWLNPSSTSSSTSTSTTTSGTGGLGVTALVLGAVAALVFLFGGADS